MARNEQERQRARESIAMKDGRIYVSVLLDDIRYAAGALRGALAQGILEYPDRARSAIIGFEFAMQRGRRRKRRR